MDKFITLSEFKDFFSIEDWDDDAIIDTLIDEKTLEFTGKEILVLETKEWRQELFWNKVVKLFQQPVKLINSVKVYSDWLELVLEADQFHYNAEFLTLKVSWEYVVINAEVGRFPADEIPIDIKWAVRMMVHSAYMEHKNKVSMKKDIKSKTIGKFKVDYTDKSKEKDSMDETVRLVKEKYGLEQNTSITFI